MALEPKGVSVEEDKTELIDMMRRFWVCSVLSFSVLLLVMLDHLPGRPLALYISSATALWVEFALSTPVMLWGAIPFFKKAWVSVVSRHLNMFTLIALGTGVAYLYSLVAFFLPDIFPEKMRMENGLVDVYFEAAAVIITLVILGQVMELRARSQTNNAIRSLLDLAPKTAFVVQKEGADKEMPLADVVPGDHLRVRPGDSVPLDGVIVEGNSTLDESMITGESMPLSKSVGDKVTGGALNQTGSFIMEAQKVGNETLLSQIVQRVAEAQRSRAPTQKMADRVAGYFVPAVVGVAVLTAIVWGIWGPEPALSYGMINAVAVLIIACPCAVGLATPMSIMVGTGRGAEAGILIKNAESLEVLEKIDVLVIDKTGTLTEGKPKLAVVLAEKHQDADELLQLAASLEQGSEHPLATAIVKGAQDKDLALLKIKDFESFTGKGVTGTADGKHVALGNDKLLEVLKVAPSDLLKQADDLRSQGQTVMLVMIDHKLAGLIGVADPLKETTPQALNDLRKSGLRLVMLTGDNETTARAVAGKLGIAMGTGADIAMESAEVTLVKGDLTGIVRARRLSQATMKNIRQNLFFAFIYNATGVPIAAGILYPVFDLLLNPIIASTAMVFSSVSVILNAARLRKVEL